MILDIFLGFKSKIRPFLCYFIELKEMKEVLQRKSHPCEVTYFGKKKHKKKEVKLSHNMLLMRINHAQ